jgi:hypothetical protein
VNAGTAANAHRASVVQVREGLKALSDWPTYPQLYAAGELLGGCDIILELAADKALRSTIDDALEQVRAPLKPPAPALPTLHARLGTGVAIFDDSQMLGIQVGCNGFRCS